MHTVYTILHITRKSLTLTGYGRHYKIQDAQKTIGSRSEYTNVVSNPILLVLRNALCYPRDVADFLCKYQLDALSR